MWLSLELHIFSSDGSAAADPQTWAASLVSCYPAQGVFCMGNSGANFPTFTPKLKLRYSGSSSYLHHASRLVRKVRFNLLSPFSGNVFDCVIGHYRVCNGDFLRSRATWNSICATPLFLSCRIEPPESGFSAHSCIFSDKTQANLIT
jgi:hypothetical protein